MPSNHKSAAYFPQANVRRRNPLNFENQGESWKDLESAAALHHVFKSPSFLLEDDAGFPLFRSFLHLLSTPK
jgi:hypothetical protein